MSILFVSDVHLYMQESLITTGFLHFLRTHAIDSKELYILGDLFEIWIGDDDPNPLYQKITLALKELARHGVSCYFIHGNRDFLLNKHHATIYGMTLLPAQRVMKLYGIRFVVLHGDILCTDDNNYQSFRRRVRRCWLQKIFLSLPLWLRLRIANKLRSNSQRINTNKNSNILDVNTKAVISMMDITNATVMIHGHTHKPAIHQLPGKRHRIVLGAWSYQGSVIKVSDKGIILYEFPFNHLNS